MKTVLIILTAFIIGCATSIGGLMRFQDRELIIHPDKSGLAYPHYVTKCEKRKLKWLGKKCKKVHVVDFYDFNDKAIRDKLDNAGFTCKSRLRFKY